MFMNYLARSPHALRCLFAASVLITATTQAAPSANLTVTGRLTPPSCDLTLDSDGRLDFGERPFNSLAPDGTKVGEKAIGLQVTCNGETRIGLRVVDNRASSKVPKADLNVNAWATPSSIITDDFIYGLGTVAGADDAQIPIGGYMFGFKDPDIMANGSKAYVIYSANLQTWRADIPSRHYLSPNFTYSFVIGSPGGGNGTPVPITSVNGALTVVPTINRSSALPTGTDIAFDGSATISLVYL
jgi:type 1 fimbria pilin